MGRRAGVRVWEHAGAITGFDALVTMWPDRRAAVVVLQSELGDLGPAQSLLATPTE